MERYEIVLLNTAMDDIDSICEYIYYQYCSPEYSERFKDKLFKAISSLEILPKRNKRLKYGKYRMRVNNYMIVYSVSEDNKKVLISDVIHQKRIELIRLD